MSGLENILAKISKDAKDKAALILDEAKEKAALEKKEVIDGANREKQRLAAEAEVLAARAKEQVVSGINLDIRNQKLEAKQQTIEKVFSESIKRLNDMQWDDFSKFAVSYCKNAEIKDGDEIILPEKFQGQDVKKIDPKLSPCSHKRFVSGGFVLVSGGIEQNNTFKALLDFIKSDLEALVVGVLF